MGFALCVSDKEIAAGGGLSVMAPCLAGSLISYPSTDCRSIGMTRYGAPERAHRVPTRPSEGVASHPPLMAFVAAPHACQLLATARQQQFGQQRTGLLGQDTLPTGRQTRLVTPCGQRIK